MSFLNVTQYVNVTMQFNESVYGNKFLCYSASECSELCQSATKISIHNTVMYLMLFTCAAWIIFSLVLKYKPEWITEKDGYFFAVFFLCFAAYLYLNFRS